MFVANSRSTKFIMRDAARASGFALNTLRSLYTRGHFQIVGGADKKGRGLAADLSLEDVMCIAVAKAAMDAGVHPRTAFEAGKTFAYSSANASRLPSHLFEDGETILVWRAANGTTEVVNAIGSIALTDLFYGAGPRAVVVVPLDDLVHGVLRTLEIED